MKRTNVGRTLEIPYSHFMDLFFSFFFFFNAKLIIKFIYSTFINILFLNNNNMATFSIALVTYPILGRTLATLILIFFFYKSNYNINYG